ncbi:MAG TPA: radical SAM protein [bacterium]|nr:radical SAM protein [bacterium]
MKLSAMLKNWPRSLLFRTPYTCNIKITTRCNLRCGFCGLWSMPVHRELSLDQYRVVADLLKQVGLARAVITGGEPLLREDTPEIIGLFSRRNISTTLLTNGTLLKSPVLNRMIRMGLNDIGISLDSLDPSRLETICGRPGIWHRVDTAIRRSVEKMPGGVVEVLTTVTRDNLSEIPDIVAYVTRDLGAWSVINPVNIPPTDASILSADTGTSGPPFDAGEVDRVYDTLKTMKTAGARILVSDRFLEDSRHYLKTGDFAWRCDAGERYFTIFPDGGLAPCSDQASIRDIMTMTPQDFRSRTYRSTVRDVQKRCGGCIFSCWREASYLFSEPSVRRERLRGLYRMIRWR